MTKLGLLVTCAIALTGCPKKSVNIYRSLSAPGAMETCDANKQYRANVDAASEKEARAKGEAQIRDLITKEKGCGALIFNEGAGKKLDGGWNYVADFQFCRCK
jgi:hypothetical protein